MEWVFYDGECALCRRAVTWFQRSSGGDAAATLRAVPFQDAPEPPMTPALRAACEHAVHVRTADGRILRAGRATLFLLERAGWRGTARVLAVPPLIWLFEIVYWLVAHNRNLFAHVLFTRVPDPGPAPKS